MVKMYVLGIVTILINPIVGYATGCVSESRMELTRVVSKQLEDGHHFLRLS